MRDIHGELTNKVVRAIESGLATGEAWTKPWHSAAASGLPTNHATQTHYRSLNVISLWFAAAERGYEHGLWLTYKQAQSIGAQVRSGERGTAVIKFGQYEREDEATGATVNGAYLKTYAVFNVAQCDGITLPLVERPNLAQRIDRAEHVLERVGVPIQYGSDSAFYRPASDTVHLPHPELFRPVGDATATEAFYSVAFHEVGHNAVIEIMPHGLRWWAVCWALAMRRFGIIRALRGTRGVGHRAGTGSLALRGRRRARGPFPSSACRRGCRIWVVATDSCPSQRAITA